MKKLYFILLILLIGSLKLSAITYTSNGNGNWMSFTTWSPVGVPIPGDIVIINHNVILDTSFAYTSGSITVNASGSLIQDSPVRDIWLNGVNATLTNNGAVDIRYLLLSSGSFTNSGNFNVKSIANFITVDNTVSGTINGLDSMYTDGVFNNNGVMNVSTFFNDSTINNYGTIQGLTTVVDSMYNNGYMFNDSTAIVYADSCTNNGSFWNEGRLIFNQFTNLSGGFNNENYMQIVDITNIGTFNNNDSVVIGNDMTNLGFVQNFWTANLFQGANLYNAGTFVNASYLNFSGSLYNDSTFVNQASGLIDLGVSFLNGDTLSSNAYFANLGPFNIGDSYFNFDSIYGPSTGNFTVQDTSYNHTTGKMTGSFDFCDATPPATSPFIDFNFGIVDPTITYCIVGVEENILSIKTLIYPNPTTGIVNIQYNEVVFIEVINILGKEVLTTKQNQVDLSNYENGIYLFRIKDVKGNILSQERIIKQ